MELMGGAEILAPPLPPLSPPLPPATESGTPGAGQGRVSPRAGGPGLGEDADLIPTAPSRSRTCCRHFLLAQLRDGRHVVLGEDSAHTRLHDLLRHYTAWPLSPYGETLGQPLARQVRPTPALILAPTLPTALTSSKDRQTVGHQMRGCGDRKTGCHSRPWPGAVSPPSASVAVLRDCHVPGTGLVTGKTAVNKTDQNVAAFTGGDR